MGFLKLAALLSSAAVTLAGPKPAAPELEQPSSPCAMTTAEPARQANGKVQHSVKFADADDVQQVAAREEPERPPPALKGGQPWYKGVSADGARKAQLCWHLQCWPAGHMCTSRAGAHAAAPHSSCTLPRPRLPLGGREVLPLAPGVELHSPPCCCAVQASPAAFSAATHMPALQSPPLQPPRSSINTLTRLLLPTTRKGPTCQTLALSCTRAPQLSASCSSNLSSSSSSSSEYLTFQCPSPSHPSPAHTCHRAHRTLGCISHLLAGPACKVQVPAGAGHRALRHHLSVLGAEDRGAGGGQGAGQAPPRV